MYLAFMRTQKMLLTINQFDYFFHSDTPSYNFTIIAESTEHTNALFIYNSFQ